MSDPQDTTTDQKEARDESNEEPAPELTAPSELERAQEEAAKLKDMLVRTAADFDNFRKRTRREIDEAKRQSREELLKELLPVFDNLERAIQSAQKATDVKAVADGVGMILKQFEGTLSRAGIARVPTVGTMFDPSMHEAIQQIETDEQPPGTVVAEVQPGYREGERLVRAAMVVVAKPKSS
ncbi:MAG TPA: nucleotide exchange factor GrpE [Polyangiaceae bacterium]|jgi:molecular chaperone GrpE